MKKSFLALASFAAMILASCSNNQYDTPDYVGGKLTVSGHIHEVQTRASGTTWNAGDQIGLSNETGQDNILFTTNEGDGIFTSSEPVYVIGGGEKAFTAYYPYEENVSGDTPAIEFSEPKDFLWASATATRENPHVSFLFKHKMTKIRISVKDEHAKKGGSIGSLQLDGVTEAGSFHTLTGQVTAKEDAKTSVSSDFAINSDASFILPVQTINNEVNVLLSYNGKIYGGKLQIAELAEGTEYHYTIDLTTADPAAELSISSATIEDWNKNEVGNIEITEQELPKEENVLEVGDFLLKDGTVIDKNDRDFASYQEEIAGVVYYVGNPQPSQLYAYEATMDILHNNHPSCTNGLALALNNANEGIAARFVSAKYDYSKWYEEAGNTLAEQYIGTNLNLTSTGERMLGYNNTLLIQKVAESVNETGAEELIALLNAFNTTYAVTNASEWYIPSYAELKAVVDNYAAVSASITKAGGSLPQYADFGTTTTENFYWSSDMRGSSYNWVSPLMIPAETVKQYLGRNSNGTKGFFRLSIAF